MAAPPPQGLSTALIVIVLVVLMLVRRTVRLVSGTPYSATRLFATAGIYVVLFALFGFATIYSADGTWGSDALILVPTYAVVVLAAASFSTGYIRRIVRFEQRNGGQWYYRLPHLVPILSLVLFITRFGAAVWVLGLSATTSFTPPTALSTGVLAVLISVDLLFGVSVGLLLGRALGVYRAFQERAGVPAVPTAPPLPES